MRRSLCSKCNRIFFFDPDLVPYRATDDNVCNLTLYQKIVTCPYCGTAFLLDKYFKEWD